MVRDLAAASPMIEGDVERAAARIRIVRFRMRSGFAWLGLVVPSGEKKRITIRLDEDVVDYFKRQGAGYQTRINDMLKAYVLSQRMKEQPEILEDDPANN